jgi:hypothetical protein
MKNGLTLSVGVAMVMIVSINTAFAGVPSYARNITAFVHINEESIKDYGSLKHSAWYTVDGEKYSHRGYHDMIEWVYPDEWYKGPIFDPIEDELMIADNASEICFQDTGDYKVCDRISGQNENATEIHFSYPLSWIPDH